MTTANQKRREEKQQEWANRYALVMDKQELAAWANWEMKDRAPVYIASLQQPENGRMYTVPLWTHFRPVSYHVTEWKRRQEAFRLRVIVIAAQTLGNPGSAINVFCK